MHELLEKITTSLDSLAVAIRSASSDERTICELGGNNWSFPSVTRHDLAILAEQLASDIRMADCDSLDIELADQIRSIPKKIDAFKSYTLPYFYNGNGGQATAAYITTLQIFREVLAPVLRTWDRVSDPDLMPKKIAQRVRSIRAQLDKLVPEADQLASIVNDIKSAHSFAEDLPTDLADLREARADLASVLKASQIIESQIAEAKKAVDANVVKLAAQEVKGADLVKQLEDLHRIGTSSALAGAFKDRAEKLQNSVNFWLFVLISSLAIAGFVGMDRMESITKLLSATQVNWQAVLANCLLAVMGLGAPVWLAWVATKQIGQRFRLAEDYAFKASISNAYEGYRREAIKLDEDFSARLFDSALSRFDEQPLRLVEPETHGSPLHEFFNSSAFKSAIEASGELKEGFYSMLRRRSKMKQPTEDSRPADKED